MLADMIASTPRPCFADQDLASLAAEKAAAIVRENPHLRGDELLRAIRKAEEDIALEYNSLLEKQVRETGRGAKRSTAEQSNISLCSSLRVF